MSNNSRRLRHVKTPSHVLPFLSAAHFLTVTVLEREWKAAISRQALARAVRVLLFLTF